MVALIHNDVTNSHSKPIAAIARVAAVFEAWGRRLREREQLARLGERELHDIGLSRASVYAEINKPFWRA